MRRHILIVSPNTTDKYMSYITGDEIRHIVPAISFEAFSIEQLQGIRLSKIEIYPIAKIEPDALKWVLAMLRDIKDDPSGIGN